MELKQFKIDDIFDVIKGYAKYTREYWNSHFWEYPVFSASNNETLTFIDSYDFDWKYLTRATNGFAWFIKIIENKFSINGDRGILVPKKNNINIDYVKFALQPILRSLAKWRIGEMGKNEFTKVHPHMIKKVFLNFPVDDDWEISTEWQEYLLGKYKKIEAIKQQIEHIQEEINNSIISFENQFEWVEIKVWDYFDFIKDARASLLTKDYINSHVGEHIVYSGNTIYWSFWKIDTYSYCLKNLISGFAILISTVWYAGEMKVIKDEYFSLSQNCWILVLKKKLENINSEYVMRVLKQSISMFLSNHWEYKSLLKKNILENKIKIPIAVDSNYDLIKQKEIVLKYEKIENIKKLLLSRLEELKNYEIEAW